MKTKILSVMAAAVVGSGLVSTVLTACGGGAAGGEAADAAAPAEVLEVPVCTVTAPPDSLGLDPFYTKYVDVNGLPLVSSWRVPDSAFTVAHATIYAMTKMLPQAMLDSMIAHNLHIGIMARYEGTTDMPEHRFYANDTTVNMEVRARGMEGTLEVPLCTCAEENVLAYQIDKYHAEDILIHEFSHSIHLMGLNLAVPGFDDRVRQCYEQAKARGILRGTYREEDHKEYFAEGMQDWFNVNAEVAVPDGKHNWCNTRDELQRFDPDLYQLIAEYFPKTSLHISRHKLVNEYTQ